MENIIFITSNIGKIASLMQRILPDTYTIESEKINLPELQATSADEVVLGKAKAAYELIKKPLIVHDSSLHIPALHNFPGIYVHYILETVGLEGIMKLMEGKKDRSCYFMGSLAFIDETKEVKVFSRKSRDGFIAKEIDYHNSPKAWSELWKVYVPYGHDKTMSSFTDEELKKFESENDDISEFTQFATWLNSKNSPNSYTP